MMPRRKIISKVVSKRSPNTLYRNIRAVLDSARTSALRAVNTAMVHAYWHVGRLIVEHEQGGKGRAAYGEAVLEDVSRRLIKEEIARYATMVKLSGAKAD